MRKSPIRHTVHTKHKRYKVNTYTRGKGAKIGERRFTSDMALTKKQGKPEGFTVTFHYKDGSSEKVAVIATNYHNAIKEALEERRRSAKPVRIDVVDPSISAVVHAIASGAKQAGRLAIKGAKRAKPTIVAAGKLSGRLAVRTAKGTYKFAKVTYCKRLIKEAYSKNRVKRQQARVMLKEYFPEVYDNMDFSRRRT